MQIGLLRVLASKKKTHISMIAATLALIIVMSALPFAYAHSGDQMDAPPASIPVTIDGVWSGGEWDDAPQYMMTDPTATNVSYIRVKYNSTHLLVIIDSVWDLTGASVYPMENTWVAIDTAHDAGAAPGWDDFLFHIGVTNFWQGNTTTWQNTWVPNAYGGQCSSSWGPGLLPSPNSGVPHRIDEMAIPLTHVGPLGSTVGFYALVEDDSSDPDGMGWLPPTSYSEWPPNAGGSPGWPGGWGASPCAAPYAWGNLTLMYTNLAIMSVTPDVSLVVQGGSVNVDVVVANNGTTTNGTNVAVFYLPNGSLDWGTWFGSQYVSVAPGTNTTVSFSWDTSWISPGVYQIRSSFEMGWNDGTASDDMALSGPVTVQAPPPPPPPPPEGVGGTAAPIIYTAEPQILAEPNMLATLLGLTSLIALIAIMVIFAKHRRKK